VTLKWFHIVFITLSMLLSIGTGVWGLFNNFVVLGVISLAGSAALSVYGPYFLRKARSLR
jgi:hypothetical protein